TCMDTLFEGILGVNVPAWNRRLLSKRFPSCGIDVSGKVNTAEELMRLPALTVAAAIALTFAFPYTLVLAQGNDDGVVGRTLRLDGGAPLGSDNSGQSSGAQSQGTERSGAVSSEKNQIEPGKTGQTTVGRHSQTRFGSRPRARHHFVMRRPGHLV